MKYKIMLLLVLGVSMRLFSDELGDTLAKKYFSLAKADTSTSDSTLIVIDKKGNKKVKTLRSFTQTRGDDSERYIEFLAPADVAGTKFLTSSKKGKDDEQRLYLPALGKIRRIASSDKNSSFMGTDISYYDLEEHDLEDYSYTAKGEATVNKTKVDILEMIPVDKDAPYSKQLVYLNKDTYYPLQIENFDKNGKLVKKLLMIKVSQYNGIYVTERMVVENLVEGSKTLMDVKNIKMNVEIPSKYFSVQNLAQ